MARWRTYNDDNYFIDVEFRDDLTTVKIVDRNTTQVAKAHALRFYDDAYDEKIGINVALSRAVSRLARKNEKYWIRQTRPSEVNG